MKNREHFKYRFILRLHQTSHIYVFAGFTSIFELRQFDVDSTFSPEYHLHIQTQFNSELSIFLLFLCDIISRN